MLKHDLTKQFTNLSKIISDNIRMHADWLLVFTTLPQIGRYLS